MRGREDLSVALVILCNFLKGDERDGRCGLRSLEEEGAGLLMTKVAAHQ